jgi:hypothetical protein
MLGLLEAACAIPGDFEQGGAAASLDWSWAFVLILVERGGAPAPFRSSGVASPSLWFARLPTKISRRQSQSVPQKPGFLNRGRFRHAVRVSARSGSGCLLG